MHVIPVNVPVQVLGVGQWNDEDAAFGFYVDLYDADEGDVMRCSIVKGSGGETLGAGDLIVPVLSSRSQAKIAGDRAIEKTQIRLVGVREISGRLTAVNGAVTPEVAAA